jgi:hypothetical protein
VTPPPAAPAPPERPRLAVLLVFDQLRADYLERWQPLFGAGGFRRLSAEGAWFRNCNYPYAYTFTGPGHASVATGCSPDRHGIVGNDWFDRARHETVKCVESDRYPTVPPRPDGKAVKGGKKRVAGVSPEHLRVPGLADALKQATRGEGRVVSLSFKDRSAVLPGGRLADACYWFNSSTGGFETSAYYRDALHPWVAAFNRAAPAERWFGREWTRLRPELDYARYSGPDEEPGEGSGFFQGRTFPHPLGGIPLVVGGDYYNALYTSPFGNDLLWELTRRGVEAEGLGSRPVPDLLCVSFSSNDAVGHCWGPDSQEVLDVTLRTDRLVADILSFLDLKVGKGRYVLALTSDHGVCPLPEVSRRQGRDAGRLTFAQMRKEAEAFLRDAFGGGGSPATREQWVEGEAEMGLYLDQATLARHGLRPAEVETALAHWLAGHRGMQAAYMRTQLVGGVGVDDALGQRVRRSFDPERSPDVCWVPRPYYVLWPTLTGTSHGTANRYDTHVPLLVYGPGIRPGERKTAVTPQAVAAILARALNVAAPAAAEAAVPDNLFGPPS